MAIGTRFALGHGVLRGISLLRSQRAALDSAMSRYAATVAMLARLGKEISSIPAAAAPMRAIRVPFKRPLGKASFSVAAAHLPMTTVHRTATPYDAALPVTTNGPAHLLARDENGMHSPRAGRTTRRNVSEQRAPRIAVRPAEMASRDEPRNEVLNLLDRTQQAPAKRPTSGSTRALPSALRNVYTLSPLPTAGLPSPNIMVDRPVDSRLPSRPVGEAAEPMLNDIQSASAISASMTPLTNLGSRANQRPQPDPQQSREGARALEHVSAAPIGTTIAQHDPAANNTAFNSVARSQVGRDHRLTNSTTTALPGNQSQSAQTDQELQRGTIVLDGAELGRWVIGYLESQSLRPGRMTTGIDPRMSATFPVAPTGA